MQPYLNASEMIDWQHPAILAKAKELAVGATSQRDIVKACFEWVRDHIRHSGDANDDTITCRASDVLAAETGYCYAKSHLLAALLRAHTIPTGLCYQRLSRDDNGAPYCLHGLCAVYLDDFGWYRLDPRGNKPGVQAEFCPPTEKLAFPIQFPEEADLPEIWPEPLPVVINVLQTFKSAQTVRENLPDVPLISRGS